MRQGFGLLLGLAAAMAVACGGDDEGPEQEGPIDDEAAARAKARSECASACARIVECRESEGDCERECFEDYPSRVSCIKCVEGASCSELDDRSCDAICRRSESCVVDADCGIPGTVCEDDVCSWIPECRRDSDCGEGEICDDSLCIVPDCFEHEDCGRFAECYAGYCEPTGECETDEDCGEDGACYEGWCELDE